MRLRGILLALIPRTDWISEEKAKGSLTMNGHKFFHTLSSNSPHKLSNLGSRFSNFCSDLRPTTSRSRLTVFLDDISRGRFLFSRLNWLLLPLDFLSKPKAWLYTFNPIFSFNFWISSIDILDNSLLIDICQIKPVVRNRLSKRLQKKAYFHD